ncbi:hypothetical protein OIO90_005145 [Microbotryomycetes sp. JL221]|nr:hypothetical protein OIO90_005145 [Microbotryomycetes sp. JL221]
MSGRTLSKGTLGLKFMNRVQNPAPSPTSTAQKQSSDKAVGRSASTSTNAAVEHTKTTENRDSKDQVKAQADQQDTWQDGQWSRRAATTSRGPVIVQESSLLSFPLLGNSNKNHKPTSAATESHSSRDYYSSMPLTSGVISGRRSFGGANIDIEQLNDPSKKESLNKKSRRDDGDGEDNTDSKESNTQRKKRLKREREAQLTTGRAGAKDKTNVASRARDGESTPQTKTKFESGKFARPSGFEGAKRAQDRPKVQPPSQTVGKRKQSNNHKQKDVVWNKTGVKREWDADKVEDSSEQEDEDDESESESDLNVTQEHNGTSGQDSSSQDEDKDSGEDNGVSLLVSSSVPTSGRPSQDRKRDVQRALQKAETNMTGESKLKGSNKKRRR